MRTIVYFAIGILFGITMFKSEAASWFRIYEMFRFNAFHMYGIIGSALFCGAIITFFLKKFKVQSILDGTEIVIEDKASGWKRYLFGGLFFWFWLGYFWCLSWANVYHIRRWFFSYPCCHSSGNPRNLLLWLDTKASPALKRTGNPRGNGLP